MDDVRWFAPNRYCTLPVARLREQGLTIALDGDAPAGLAVVADGQCAVAGFEYSLRHNVPFILYVWDLPPWWLGRGRPDWVFVAGNRVRRVPRLFGRFPERAGFLSRIRYIARRAHQVWAPSTATTTEVARHFDVRTALVPFCYDSDRFRPLAAPTTVPNANGPPTVLSISRLVPHKNHQIILRAATRLRPSPEVHLVGQGPEGPALRALAEQLGVRLRISEGLSDEQIVEAYQAASLVVCPSRFEGLGLTPHEALALGRPVIASDIAPHREFLGHRVRFFEPDDDTTLANQMVDALSLSGRHRPDPTAELTVEACAGRFGDRLKSVLARST